MAGTLHGATAGELRNMALQTANAAKAITDAAVKADRDLSEAEAEKVQNLLLQVDGLKARMSAQAADDKSAAATRSLLTLDDIKAVGGGDALATKAQRAAQWGKAVVKACSDGPHFKGLTASGSVLVAVPQPEPVSLGRPVASVRSLIATQRTDGQFVFLRQTVRQNASAPVAPGDLKPTSVYTFERVEDRARVIAHLSEPLSRMDLADAPLLSEFLATEMTFGLEQTLEDQILNGNGVGENMLGLAHTPGILTAPITPNSTSPDLILTVRRAVTRLEAQGIQGTGWVLNPADYEAIETSMTSDGALVMQGAGQRVPVDPATRRLWGIPVSTSIMCPAGVGWLADFTGSVKLYVREEARIDWSSDTWRPDALGAGQGASDFQRNLVSMRVEGRFGFAVTRPSGVVKITLA